MELLTVTSENDPHLAYIKALYESTFPVQERRDWPKLLQLLQEPAMKLSTVFADKEAIGFVIGWQIGDWYYVEHLAIDPAQRGKKYGERVMETVLEAGRGKVILEVERVHDTNSQRRIGFYERLGYTIVNYDYVQPPYRKGDEVLPLLLMSRPAITDATEAGIIANQIKFMVYERYY